MLKFTLKSRKDDRHGQKQIKFEEVGSGVGTVVKVAVIAVWVAFTLTLTPRS